MGNLVSIIKTDIYKYPEKSPFDPPKIYPEFVDKLEQNVDETNNVYDIVREALILLGLDKENIGKKVWNSFKKLLD